MKLFNNKNHVIGATFICALMAGGLFSANSAFARDLVVDSTDEADANTSYTIYKVAGPVDLDQEYTLANSMYTLGGKKLIKKFAPKATPKDSMNTFIKYIEDSRKSEEAIKGIHQALANAGFESEATFTTTLKKPINVSPGYYLIASSDPSSYIMSVAIGVDDGPAVKVFQKQAAPIVSLTVIDNNEQYPDDAVEDQIADASTNDVLTYTAVSTIPDVVGNRANYYYEIVVNHDPSVIVDKNSINVYYIDKDGKEHDVTHKPNDIIVDSKDNNSMRVVFKDLFGSFINASSSDRIKIVYNAKLDPKKVTFGTSRPNLARVALKHSGSSTDKSIKEIKGNTVWVVSWIWDVTKYGKDLSEKNPVFKPLKDVYFSMKNNHNRDTYSNNITNDKGNYKVYGVDSDEWTFIEEIPKGWRGLDKFDISIESHLKTIDDIDHKMSLMDNDGKDLSEYVKLESIDKASGIARISIYNYKDKVIPPLTPPVNPPTNPPVNPPVNPPLSTLNPVEQLTHFIASLPKTGDVPIIIIVGGVGVIIAAGATIYFVRRGHREN